MGHSKVIVLALMLASCAQIQRQAASMKESRREPGAKMQASPEQVAQELGCEHRQLPYVVLEKSELLPRTVRNGEEFNHRFIYAACPRQPGRTIVGTLRTRIYYNGEVVWNDVDKTFDIRPGRWTFDTFIKVPNTALSGKYQIDLDFRSSHIRFKNSEHFVVADKR